MCISKNEKYRSGCVTVMRFGVFGALKKIRTEHVLSVCGSAICLAVYCKHFGTFHASLAVKMWL